MAKLKYHPSVFILALTAGPYLCSQGNSNKTGHALHGQTKYSPNLDLLISLIIMIYYHARRGNYGYDL